MENAKVNITLSVNEWNVVLNAIAARPFSEVHLIINEINKQAMAQAKETEAPSNVAK